MSKIRPYIATLLVTAATLLTACHSDADPIDEPTTEAVPITFSVSIDPTASSTRAFATGEMTSLRLAETGFGVFCEGDDGDVNFSNTKVYFNGKTKDGKPDPDAVQYKDVFLYPGNWTYGTQKYWPRDTDKKYKKLKFLAYAPYSSNDDNKINETEKTISYTVEDTAPSNAVDLLWAVNEMTGLPWQNAAADDTGGNILFTFRHATAALAFRVKLGGDLSSDNTVTLTVTKVTLQHKNKENGAPPQFAKSGTLNIDNSATNGKKHEPLWTTDTSDGIASLTATRTSESASDFSEDTENGGYVTTYPFLLIPENKTDYTATIEYTLSYTTPDGEKKFNYTSEGDDKLGPGTATISGLALTAGVKHYLNFVIGLKTVQLSVTATDWADQPLPVNVTIEHGTSANSSLARKRQ